MLRRFAVLILEVVRIYVEALLDFGVCALQSRVHAQCTPPLKHQHIRSHSLRVMIDHFQHTPPLPPSVS
jgi:hypothetical protein